MWTLRTEAQNSEAQSPVTVASGVHRKPALNYTARRPVRDKTGESDRTFKEFLGTYNKVTENCFMDCVRDFTTRDVKPEESSCSESCLQKYLKMTQRISMRFQEYHIQQNEALAAKAGLLGQPR
uniref:Mitochondrial import inner membrane translocase subunit n=2 Tax=Oreochromis TaxID=8139 RepID=A0A669EBX4_ORENI